MSWTEMTQTGVARGAQSLVLGGLGEVCSCPECLWPKSSRSEGANATGSTIKTRWIRAWESDLITEHSVSEGKRQRVGMKLVCAWLVRAAKTGSSCKSACGLEGGKDRGC